MAPGVGGPVRLGAPFAAKCPPAVGKQRWEVGEGRWYLQVPSALTALGGRSTGKSQHVLQAKMWVPWVLSCSVRGPMAGPVTPPLPHVPGCLPQRLSVALLGHLLTHSSLPVPALPWARLPLVFLSSSRTRILGLERLCLFKHHSPSG